MDALNLGICSPRLAPPPNARRLHRFSAVSGGASSAPTTFSASKWADRLFADFQFLPSPSTPDPPDHKTTTATLTPPLDIPERNVSLPIDFYRVLGAEPHFLGDGIRRAYEARISKPPQYGYSHEALISRRQILQAACETLADPSSRRDYNQGLANHEFDTILTQVPWDKVPGALCVLNLFVIPLGDGEASVRRQGNSFYTATESYELSHGDETFPENMVGFAERSPCDDQEQEMITEKIKDAVVKITSAGVAVGLLTLIGLKFLPSRADSSILRKDDRLPVTADAVSIGPSNVEVSEEVPRMEARFAESLVRKWQNIKSQALGPDHRLEKLSESGHGQMVSYDGRSWMGIAG